MQSQGKALFFRLACTVTAASIVAGCEGSKPASGPPKAELKVKQWQQALQGDLYPLADGSAYAEDGGRLFYFKAGMMQEVSGIAPNIVRFGSITPLADGSAILSRLDEPDSYWLKGPTATKIEPGQANPQASANTGTPGFYFVTAAALKRRMEDPEYCNDIAEANADADSDSGE